MLHKSLGTPISVSASRRCLHRHHHPHHGSRPSSRVTAAAASQAPVVQIPMSREDAISDAITAAVFQLQPSAQAKGPAKGFGKASSRKQVLCLDLPIASQSSQDVAELGRTMALELAMQLRSTCTLVFADEQAAAACYVGNNRSLTVLGLRQACRKSQLTGGALLIVAPKVSDVALCDQLVTEVWAGSGVVMANSEFAVTRVPSPSPDLEPFLESLTTVYCFQPVAVKGLLGNQEGAVLKRVERGDPNATPFKILKEEKGTFIQIGQSQKRPDNDDLEATFINAAAAKSPLSRAASALRGVFSKGKQ